MPRNTTPPAVISPRSAAARRRAAVTRRRFIAEVGSIEPFQQMFDQIPGVHFCVKDTRSRLIWGNNALFQRLAVHEDDLVGTNDHQYFPSYVAESFIADDQEVLRTGRPLLNRVGVWYNEQRMLDWFVKNKFPLRDRAGRVIGLIVSIQSYERMKHAHTPYAELSGVVEHIRNHLGDRLAVDRLAKLGGVSPRQLHRRFQAAFGLSVQEFLMRTRIQAAQDTLINSARSISEIAHAFGFCDQSAFTQSFRRHTGMTPRRFRVRYTMKVARAV
jgi:AraC-like DNA-binding protein